MAQGVGQFILDGFRGRQPQNPAESAIPLTDPYAAASNLGMGFALSLFGRWIAKSSEPVVREPRAQLIDQATHPTRWVFGGLVRVPMWMIWHGNMYVKNGQIPSAWKMGNTQGSPNAAILDSLMWIGEGKIDEIVGMFVGEDYIHFEKDGSRYFSVASQKYTGKLLAQAYFGDATGPTNLYARYASNAAPLSARIATTDHSYIHLQLQDYIQDNSFWLREGVPTEFDAVVRGNLCYDLTASDPETANRVWRNDAASIWYTIERDCHSATADELHLDSFRDAYNVCQHNIANDYNLYESQTGSALAVGQQAKSYYNNYPLKSRRYSASIVVNSGDNPRVTRERLSLAMCGSHTISNGKLVIYAGANRRTVVHIRDEDVKDNTVPTRYSQQKAENKTHVIEARYVSQGEGLKEVTRTFKDDASIQRDGGLRIIRQIDFDCTDDSEVTRKAKQILASQRLEETIGITLNGQRDDFLVGEYVDLSSSGLSITKKPYRVISKEIAPSLSQTQVYLKEAPPTEFTDSFELPPLSRRDLNKPLPTATEAADGQGFEFVYLANDGTTPTAPLNSWGYDSPVSPWSDDAPGLTQTNHTLWRSRRIVKGTPATGTAVDDNWTTPIIVSHYGQDGTTQEKIFFANNGTALTNAQMPANTWAYKSPTSPWSTSAPSLTSTNNTLWEAERSVVGSPAIGTAKATTWGNWSTPVISAHFGANGAAGADGQDGTDGGGFEHIYAITASETSTLTAPLNSWGFDTRPAVPASPAVNTWYDGAPAVTGTNKVLWWSTRPVSGTPANGAAVSANWSTPTVLSTFGAKGDKGDKGDRGDTGATGATGAQGQRGNDGAAGADGEGWEHIYMITDGTRPTSATNTPPLPSNSVGYNSTPATPATPAADTWYDNAPDTTASNPTLWYSEREVPGSPADGTAVTANWTTPAVLSRYGEDGIGREFIYTLYSANTLPSTRNPLNSWKYDQPSTNGGQTWYDNPQTPTKANPYQYISERQVSGVPTAGDTISANWTTPKIFGVYGEDGAGLESVHAIYNATTIPTSKRPSNTWAYDSPVAVDGLTWYDDFQAPTAANPYTFISQRRITGAPATGDAKHNSWGDWSVPVNTGRLGEDGFGLETVFTLYHTTTLPTSRHPSNGWNYDSPGTIGGQQWHDDPQTTTDANPYQFFSQRTVPGSPSKGDVEPPGNPWGDWTTPVIWSETPESFEPVGLQQFRFNTLSAFISGTDWDEAAGSFRFVTGAFDTAGVTTYTGLDNNIKLMLASVDSNGKRINWDSIPVGTQIKFSMGKESSRPRNTFIVYTISAIAKGGTGFDDSRFLTLTYQYQGQPRGTDSISTVNAFYFDFMAPAIGGLKREYVYAGHLHLGIHSELRPDNSWGFGQGGTRTRNTLAGTDSLQWVPEANMINFVDEGRGAAYNFVYQSFREYSGNPSTGDQIDAEWSLPTILGMTPQREVEIEKSRILAFIDLSNAIVAEGVAISGINTNGKWAFTRTNSTTGNSITKIEDIKSQSDSNGNDQDLWLHLYFNPSTADENFDYTFAEGQQLRFEFAYKPGGVADIEDDLIFYQNFFVVSATQGAGTQKPYWRLRLDHLGSWFDSAINNVALLGTNSAYRLIVYNDQIPPPPKNLVGKKIGDTLTVTFDNVPGVQNYILETIEDGTGSVREYSFES